MAAFVIFDVDVRDPDRYRDFMAQVKPALATAGAALLVARDCGSIVFFQAAGASS